MTRRRTLIFFREVFVYCWVPSTSNRLVFVEIQGGFLVLQIVSAEKVPEAIFHPFNYPLQVFGNTP